MAGDYTPIIHSELPPGNWSYDAFHKFSRRKPDEANSFAARAEIQNLLTKHMDTIVWTLNSSFVNLRTNREETTPACGYTYYGRLPKKTTIMLT
jgi:hypothetical protein